MESQNIQDNKDEKEKSPPQEKPCCDNDEKLTKCEKQKDEYLNGWKRAKADFINLQKDEAKRAMEIIKYSNENLIKDLLPVLDSFDISLFALKQADESVKKGFEIIHSQIENILKHQGLEKINSMGAKFNPNIHEIFEEIESDKESGTILEEIIKGWKLSGKVIRPAKVKVAK